MSRWRLLVRCDTIASFSATPPFGEDQDGEIEIRQLFELKDFGPGDAVERHREVGREMGKNR